MICRSKLEYALRYGQPGSLERLAYWLDLDCLPSDTAAFEVLIEYYALSFHIIPEAPDR